jgi:cell division protein FtsL
MKLINTFKISFLKLVAIAILIALSASIYASNDKKLNHDKWEKLTKDLSYQDDIKKVQKEKQQRTKQDSPTKHINYPSVDISGTAQIILILIVVVVLIFIISRFITKGVAVNQSVESLYMEADKAEEKLLQTDVDYLLNKAKDAKDYRLALRIYYLKMLKTLNEFHYIEWQIQKTNYQYNIELTNWNYLPDWKGVTKQYERSWYGEKSINEVEFNEQEIKLLHMIQQVKTQQPPLLN